MFAPLQGLNAQEKEASNVRVFEGDGTAYLRVPGLKSVSSVRVGSMPLPETEVRKIPKDSTLTDFHHIPIPLYDLQFTDDGNAVLLRSGFSNDGIWQRSTPIYVGGIWEEPTDAEIDEIAAEKTAKSNRLAGAGKR